MAQSSGSSPIPYAVREAMRGAGGGAKINRNVIERGQAGGHGGEIPKGGMKDFGEGGEGGGAAPRGGSAGAGDPALTGDYDRGPITTVFGIPTANEGALTTAGKQQQADFGLVQGFLGAYGAAIGRGASQTDAMHYATKSAGPDPVATIGALMRHSGGTPLQSMESFRNFLAQGAPQGPQNIGLTKDGQVLQQDAQGNVTAKDIPGLRGPAAGGTPLNPGYVRPDARGNASVIVQNPDGSYGSKPVMDSQGNPTKYVGAAGGTLPASAAGGGSAGSMKPGAAGQKVLGLSPQVMDSLSRMASYDGTGFGVGPAKAGAAEYLGVNGKAGQFQVDRANVMTLASTALGDRYKAQFDALKGLDPTNSQAPTYVKQLATTVYRDMRTQLQQLVDNSPGKASVNTEARAGKVRHIRAGLRTEHPTGREW